MASINATTSSGIVATADNTGTLQLQSAGTTSATFNSFGIGLGSATPSSGIGITFPAAQSASSDANTLDDYEEGTWTVSPVRWTWTGSKTGSYIKVGRLVHINYVVDATGISYTGAGSGWAIGGFPFPIDSVAIASLSECTAFTANLYLDNIGNELFGRNSSFTAGGIGTGSNFNSSGRIKFTVTYYTSS